MDDDGLALPEVVLIQVELVPWAQSECLSDYIGLIFRPGSVPFIFDVVLAVHARVLILILKREVGGNLRAFFVTEECHCCCLLVVVGAYLELIWHQFLPRSPGDCLSACHSLISRFHLIFLFPHLNKGALAAVHSKQMTISLGLRLIFELSVMV